MVFHNELFDTLISAELISFGSSSSCVVQAIKWLKQFYWEPQTVRLQHERSVSFQAGKEVGINFHFQARKVAEAKVHEAFCLVKEHDLSTSPQLISKKGQRMWCDLLFYVVVLLYSFVVSHGQMYDFGFDCFSMKQSP